MTVEQAIKLQEELLTLLPEVGFNKYMPSTRLGIEALKEIQWLHKIHILHEDELLPNETTE